MDTETVQQRAEQVLPPGYRRIVLLTPDEATAWTGRPSSTLRRWAREGRITRHGTPGRALYDLAELPERSTRAAQPRTRTPAAIARHLTRKATP